MFFGFLRKRSVTKPSSREPKRLLRKSKHHHHHHHPENHPRHRYRSFIIAPIVWDRHVSSFACRANSPESILSTLEMRHTPVTLNSIHLTEVKTKADSWIPDSKPQGSKVLMNKNENDKSRCEHQRALEIWRQLIMLSQKSVHFHKDERNKHLHAT